MSPSRTRYDLLLAQEERALRGPHRAAPGRIARRTAGAHCALTQLWSARLGKNELRAYQASARGGEMICRARGERVELEGACVFYMEGEAEV